MLGCVSNGKEVMGMSVDVGRGAVALISIIVLEKTVNAVGEEGGVTVFSEESNFCGSEREGSVNNESAEISWKLEPG